MSLSVSMKTTRVATPSPAIKVATCRRLCDFPHLTVSLVTMSLSRITPSRIVRLLILTISIGCSYTHSGSVKSKGKNLLSPGAVPSLVFMDRFFRHGEGPRARLCCELGRLLGSCSGGGGGMAWTCCVIKHITRTTSRSALMTPQLLLRSGPANSTKTPILRLFFSFRN